MPGTAGVYVLERYLPYAKVRREGIALCLSGGGFRAALFHLGALRRLNEVGLLSQVDAISSVSGGSILAAVLADRLRPWPDRGTVVPQWEARVEATMRAITMKDLRSWPILNRLLPWNWLDDATAVQTLAVQYERHVTRLRLRDLPEHPRVIINATDMAFGVNWVFDSAGGGRAGDYQAGYLRPLPDWPLARAVAASSCFPPVFDPLPVRLGARDLTGGTYRAPDRDHVVRGIRLTDGGVYDNLGLEPVWKSYAMLLVSDGGGAFEPKADRGVFWRLPRYVSIVDAQVRALRKRWLMSAFINEQIAGAYWGIGSAAAHYGPEPGGYPEDLVDEVIAPIRTDLDAFSDAERAVLMNHGYLVGDTAIRRHVAPLGVDLIARPASPPFPEWLDADRVRRTLRGSQRVFVLGRRRPFSGR